MANGNFVEVSLDTTLDDIQDLPKFTVFPTGAYHVRLERGMEHKIINEHSAIVAEMTLVSVVELQPKHLNKDEEPPKEGDSSTLSFMLDNEWGAGQLKEFAKPLKEHLGLQTPRALIEGTKGIELMVVLSRTYDKDKDKYYQKAIKADLI